MKRRKKKYRHIHNSSREEKVSFLNPTFVSKKSDAKKEEKSQSYDLVAFIEKYNYKTPRLLAAAKEANIGQNSLIDFFVSKGFKKDDLKPTSKLTTDQYFELLKQFKPDVLEDYKKRKS